MKVLFVYYVPSGGVETLNRQRCRALRKVGIECHCLYFNWGAGLQNPVDFPVYVTRNDISIKHYLDSFNYDVIVVTTDHASFARFRMLGYSGKLVLEIQGYGPKETARVQLTAAQPYINTYASGLLNPCTPHIASLFQELYPHIPQFNFNNCFDPAFFSYVQAVPPASPVIAWLGRIEDNKNWREFLYIAHHLSHIIPDLQVWMFEDNHLGIPGEREQMFQLIHELHLGGRLTIRSNVPNAEMPYYFSIIGDSGGFVCSTSKVEGAPYAILEAMSCRCPVLSTNSDGVSTSVYHNVTGKYYELGNVGHAVQEGLELMQNAGMRASIRDQAQAHVRNAFSPESYVSHFFSMVHSI